MGDSQRDRYTGYHPQTTDARAVRPRDHAATQALPNFLQRLETQAIRPAVRGYYIRRAEAWIKARGNRPAETP